MSDLGFKRVDSENWLQFDEFSSLMTGGDPDLFLSEVTSPKMPGSVPPDVVQKFEAARGSLAYGYFFYPLFAIAVGELFRVLDAALEHRCDALGIKGDNFYRRLEAFKAAGHLDEEQHDLWNTGRNLRNSFSHTKMQTLLPPGPAIGLLHRIAEQINALFVPPSA